MVIASNGFIRSFTPCSRSGQFDQINSRCFRNHISLDDSGGAEKCLECGLCYVSPKSYNDTPELRREHLDAFDGRYTGFVRHLRFVSKHRHFYKQDSIRNFIKWFRDVAVFYIAKKLLLDWKTSLLVSGDTCSNVTENSWRKDVVNGKFVMNRKNDEVVTEKQELPSFDTTYRMFLRQIS